MSPYSAAYLRKTGSALDTTYLCGFTSTTSADAECLCTYDVRHETFVDTVDDDIVGRSVEGCQA